MQAGVGLPKKVLGGFSLYALRFLRYELQIFVHAQSGHVTFTILYTKLISLQLVVFLNLTWSHEFTEEVAINTILFIHST